MKRIFTYLLILTSVLLQAQSVFTRIRNNPEEIKKNQFVLDSCSTNNYYKDSVLFYSGYSALKQNNTALARQHCKELLKTFPAFDEAHYLSGLIYLSGKNYGKSVTEFSTLLQKKPKHIKALYNRALAFGLMEEYDKAIEDLTSCIALKPIYSLAYYSRGYWHELLGDYPSAIKDYETTINLDPKNYDAYIGLAYIYQGLKSNAKSCEIINNAIKAGSQIAEEVKDNFCR
ncbi:MAG: tetratricopeptide repeat protein [Bacteroidetes bacterium]|nr:tetratricopeptide repeat protein [Bacteroidota bacterium]